MSYKRNLLIMNYQNENLEITITSANDPTVIANTASQTFNCAGTKYNHIIKQGFTS